MNEYKLMIAPFHHNGFRSLSKKQAEEYFHWYVGQSKERIEQLYEYVQSTGGAAFLCEYTPDSLIELWNWFETQIDMVAKSEEEYQAELKQFPEWMHDSISKKRFSVRTLAIITDISFYFAETFIKHNPMVRWGYFTKPKNEVSVNMPVLLGFKSNMKLDPRRIVSVCASESFEQHDKNRLRNAYRTWTKYTAEYSRRFFIYKGAKNMKTIIGEVKGIFSEYGYKKERNSFWKIENDFYKLINFQHGAYGDYLFVNVGLHPVGLPSLYTGKLEIKEKPKEHECIIRQRMEQIVPIPSLEKALTFPTHENIVQDIIFNFPKVETWLKEWGSWENIANTHFDDIEKIISVVPITQKKAYFMLKYYCMIKLGRRSEAEKFLNAYSEENSTMDFTLVDCFLNNLLSEI